MERIEKKGKITFIVGVVLVIICVLWGFLVGWRFYYGIWFGAMPTTLFLFMLIIGCILVVLGLVTMIVKRKRREWKNPREIF